MDTVQFYFEQLSQYPPLSREAFNELFKRYKRGDQEALEQLTLHNLRLVVSIAKRYASMTSFEDLIQEGNIGLMKALQNFDLSFGVKFSTYATYWIQRHCLNQLNRSINDAIFKKHALDLLYQYTKMGLHLMQQKGREVNPEETLERMDLPETEKHTLRQLLTLHVMNLEMPVNEEKDITLQDTIKDEKADQSDQFLDRLQIDMYLDILTEAERFVVINRYGLKGHPEMRTQELCEKMDLSDTSIAALEFKAMRKLRKHIMEKETAWHDMRRALILMRDAPQPRILPDM